jgi:cobalamin biosynthesis protein CobD/CbiB
MEKDDALLLFALAYALDWLIGDQEWAPHPVRWMGRLIQVGENFLRRFIRGPRAEFIGGRDRRATGGMNYYDGEPHYGPRIGAAKRPLDDLALRHALRMTACASLLMFVVCLSVLCSL